MRLNAPCTGHFWEKRYHSTSFSNNDQKRALNTLRYIHANPQAAGLQQGFFYDFSNYGVYERLGDDGLTTWHPAFLALGETLDDCAKKYKNFCHQYKPQPKPEKKCHWGSILLPKLTKFSKKAKDNKSKKTPPKKDEEAQQLWEIWLKNNPEIMQIAEKFIFANCYNPAHVEEFLKNYTYY